MHPWIIYLFRPCAHIIVQNYRPFWLYFIAFSIVIAGLITYFWSSTRKPPCFSLIFIHLIRHLAEEQGFLDPQAPDYVHRKRGGPALSDDVVQEV
jgi:solute carrier family 35 protein F1/2